MKRDTRERVSEEKLAIAREIVDQFKAGAAAHTGAEADPGGIRAALEDQLIPLLQQIQEGYGYLPEDVLQWVSRETRIPTSRMHGVITFYSQFYTEPRGKHVIQCCRGTACHVKGAAKLIDAIHDELGLSGDGTTDDMEFTLETVACLGACAMAPVVVVDSSFYGRMDVDKVRKLIQNTKKEQ